MRKEEERLNDINNETKLEKDQFDEYVKFFNNNKQKIIEEKKSAYEMKLQEEKRLREQMTEVFEDKREGLEKEAENNIEGLRERNESEIKRITDEMKDNDCNKLL
jgi:adenylosuccinate synthase